MFFVFFFFNDTATTEIYTLSLHDALPISWGGPLETEVPTVQPGHFRAELAGAGRVRSEEHTSELQSQSNLVCRLLLEKKKNKTRLKVDHYTPIDDGVTVPHALLTLSCVHC